jgi:hypothetical protein
MCDSVGAVQQYQLNSVADIYTECLLYHMPCCCWHVYVRTGEAFSE